MAYKDYIVARNWASTGLVLCQAPAWSHLEPDDEIILDSGCKAVVVSSITLTDDADALYFIKSLAEQDRIPKIKSKVVYDGYTYPDDTENEDNSNEQTV